MMSMETKYALWIIGIGVLYFLLIEIKELIMLDQNQFWDKFVGRTLWIWLPIYGLQRLIKEVILKKK